jgi:pyrimidine operon attenuation protein/uracil phosphoribosyltransferase
MSTNVPDAELAYAALLDQMQGIDRVASRLVGIHSGGVWVAKRLAGDLALATPVGELDISFYRDDFDRIGLHAEVKPTQIGFEVGGADIILVDDVLYTGRTIRGAMHVLFDYGRPARIDLAVLAVRPGRELPIEARWSGGTADVPPGKELVLSQYIDANARTRFRLELATAPVEA